MYIYIYFASILIIKCRERFYFLLNFSDPDVYQFFTLDSDPVSVFYGRIQIRVISILIRTPGCQFTCEHVEPDGRSLEDGRFASVVAGVGGPRVLDDQVAPRVLPVLGQHCDPAPKHKCLYCKPTISR